MRNIAIGCCALTLSLLAASPGLAQRKKPVRKAPPPSSAPAKAAPAPAPPPAAPAAEPAPESAAPPPAAPAPAAAAVVAEPAPARAEEPVESPGKAEKHEVRLLEAALALDFFQRHLSYGGDTQNVFPPYDMNGAPAAELSAGIFPYRTPSWSVGLSGRFAYAFALNTDFKVPNGNQSGKYTTRSSQYAIGPRGRYHFGRSSFVGLGVEYGGQNYSIDLPPPTPTNASVPDVAYSYLRPNVEARIDIVPNLAAVGNAGYLVVLNAGEILSDTYFVKSRSSVFAFDVNVGVAWEVAPHIEIHPAVDLRRYHFTFNPLLSDPRIATSANDMFLGFSLGVGYWM
jgi:hypothetical protein